MGLTQRRPTPRSACCDGTGATQREQRNSRIPVPSETSVQHGLVGNLADDEGHAAGLVGKRRHVDPCRPVRVEYRPAADLVPHTPSPLHSHQRVVTRRCRSRWNS